MVPSGGVAGLGVMSVVPKPGGLDLPGGSGESPASGIILAQASPGDGAAAPPARPVAVPEVGRSVLPSGQALGAVGEGIVRHMEALHTDEGRYGLRGQSPDADTDPAVKLVVAREPGPAEAALVPGARRAPAAGTTDSFDANLAALRRFNNHMLHATLVSSAVSASIGSLKTLTERMG
jgi:hypothetical protein